MSAPTDLRPSSFRTCSRMSSNTMQLSARVQKAGLGFCSSPADVEALLGPQVFQPTLTRHSCFKQVAEPKTLQKAALGRKHCGSWGSAGSKAAGTTGERFGRGAQQCLDEIDKLLAPFAIAVVTDCDRSFGFSSIKLFIVCDVFITVTRTPSTELNQFAFPSESPAGDGGLLHRCTHGLCPRWGHGSRTRFISDSFLSFICPLHARQSRRPVAAGDCWQQALELLEEVDHVRLQLASYAYGVKAASPRCSSLNGSAFLRLQPKNATRLSGQAALTSTAAQTPAK